MKHSVTDGVQYLFGGKFLLYVGTKGIATQGFWWGNYLGGTPTKMCDGVFRSRFPVLQLQITITSTDK